jgi:hypothetical protein
LKGIFTKVNIYTFNPQHSFNLLLSPFFVWLLSPLASPASLLACSSFGFSSPYLITLSIFVFNQSWQATNAMLEQTATLFLEEREAVAARAVLENHLHHKTHLSLDRRLGPSPLPQQHIPTIPRPPTHPVPPKYSGAKFRPAQTSYPFSPDKQKLIKWQKPKSIVCGL